MNEKHNPKFTPKSQYLRKNMTKEERHLWYDFLKGLPVTIQRQKTIGHHIVDFYCASAKLVIEIDGSQHFEPDKIEADFLRDKYLNSLGIAVKRYANIEVNKNFEYVCTDIFHTIFPDEK
jgi:very-short-patch-repair endonuclease